MPHDDHGPVQDETASRAGSFPAIVTEYWPTIYRMLYCTLGNRHDAEDLTQETFLRAWRRLDTFRAGTGMRVWLLQIAANAALDVHRRRQRVSFGPLVHEPPADHPGPEHRLEAAESSAVLKSALEQLSELTRLVFHLRVQEELSFREIAGMVGTTEQGARWHMHHARTKLVKQFVDQP